MTSGKSERLLGLLLQFDFNMDVGSGKTPSSVASNSTMIRFNFRFPLQTLSRASLNEYLTPAQRARPFFYTFLPRMSVSLFLEGRFATTATFDDEIIVDSSHLLLPTWPSPR